MPKDLRTTATTTEDTGVSTRGEGTGTGKHNLVPSAKLTWEQVLHAQLQSLHEGDLRGCFAFASPKNKAFIGSLEHFEIMIRGSYSSMLDFEWYMEREVEFLSSTQKCTYVMIGKGASQLVGQFEWCLSKQPATADCPGCWMTDHVTDHVFRGGYSIKINIGPKHSFDTSNTANGMEKTPKDKKKRHATKSGHHHHDHADKHHKPGHSHEEKKHKEHVKSKHGRHHGHRNKHHQHHHGNDFDFYLLPAQTTMITQQQQQIDGGDGDQMYPLIGAALMTILLGLLICFCCILRSRASDTVAPAPTTENQDGDQDQDKKKRELVKLHVDVIGAPVQDDVEVIGKAVTDDDVVLVVGRSIE